MKLFSYQSNINNDIDNHIYKDSVNSKIGDYYLTKSNHPIDQSFDISLNHQCFNVKEGVGVSNPCNIDNDSFLRNGDNLTNKNYIQQLNPRHILTTPLKNNMGDNNIIFRDRITPQVTKNKIKSVNRLDTCNNDRFHYLVDEVKKLQTPENIISELNRSDWIRGGLTTRELSKDPLYLKKMGYKYNGKFWFK